MPKDKDVDHRLNGVISTNGTASGWLSYYRYWGDQSLQRAVDQLFEESGELAQALMRHRYPIRHNGKVFHRREIRDSVITEAADVLVCLDFILKHFNVSKKEIDHLVTERAVTLGDALEQAKHKEPREA